MMDESDRKVVYLQITKRDEEEVACEDPLMSSSVQIMYCFSWETWHHYTKFEYGEQTVTELQKRKIWNDVYLEPQQSLSYRNMRKIIDDALMAWPICKDSRKSLIREVFSRTQAMMESMTPAHYVLHIDVDVREIYYHTIISRPLRLRQPIEDDVYYNMVPASKSSIKSLKRKKLDDKNNDCDRCTICLDKFPKKYRVTHMPCSHMFHGNCVKRWLETSHYCPVCRFEMPTK